VSQESAHHVYLRPKKKELCFSFGFHIETVLSVGVHEMYAFALSGGYLDINVSFTIPIIIKNSSWR